MKMGLLTIITVLSAVSAWATKALADGKIDAAEAAELVTTICGALGVQAAIELPKG